MDASPSNARYKRRFVANVRSILAAIYGATFILALRSAFTTPRFPSLRYRISHPRYNRVKWAHPVAWSCVQSLPPYRSNTEPLEVLAQVLVSYSYFEKDEGQKENFHYFILAGMGMSKEGLKLPLATDFSLVVSGDTCGPCGVFSGLVQESRLTVDGVAEIWDSARIVVLHRSENNGMDFAAHNVCDTHSQIHCATPIDHQHTYTLRPDVSHTY